LASSAPFVIQERLSALAVRKFLLYKGLYVWYDEVTMPLSKRKNLVVGTVGKDGRTSAIEWRLRASPLVSAVVSLASGKGQNTIEEILESVSRYHPDFVVIGPEEPLAHGVVDHLERIGIPCVGPRAALAKLESSKAFTRELLKRHGIPGNPEYRVFRSLTGVAEYLRFLQEFVIKPDGLTGGKGVRVSGEHLRTVEDGVQYCKELLAAEPGAQVVIEEKLDGEEFSFQSLSDGVNVVHTIPVQDHKRAYAGDTGPNTGGMGSYTCENHLLPFLSRDVIAQASSINKLVAEALYEETGEKFKGVLFGGFMETRNGLRLLEYNARFGDPEAMNVLSLLETDFAEVCLGIINEELKPLAFRPLATVCLYVVPLGYPSAPRPGVIRNLPQESDNLKVFQASLDEQSDGFHLMGSRALALVGLGKDLSEAYSYAKRAADQVEGPVFFRPDIGTPALIERRVAHMEHIRHRPAV
jgi:phosphoribosylamine--glycine ligase